MTSILIAEEDAATRAFLCDNLAADGYAVESAADALEAHAVMNGEPFDVLIVDVNGSTNDLLRARARTQVTIALTGGDKLDLIRKLDYGADDVMTKPFSYPELRARVEACIRRGDKTPKMIRVGDLTVDLSARMVTLQAVPIDVSRKEFDLLRLLATDPTRVFTKNELLRTLRGRQQGTTRTLDSHACRLRAKLSVGGEYWVHNVWGVGYRLTDPSVA